MKCDVILKTGPIQQTPRSLLQTTTESGPSKTFVQDEGLNSSFHGRKHEKQWWAGGAAWSEGGLPIVQCALGPQHRINRAHKHMPVLLGDRAGGSEVQGHPHLRTGASLDYLNPCLKNQAHQADL